MATVLFMLKRGFFFIVDNWKVTVPAIAILIALLGFGIWYATRPPKIRFDEEQIRKAQKAIETDDRKAMLEVLETSKVREANIDANLANAENTKLKVLSESRKETSKMTNAELAAELERLAREQ